MPDTPYYAMTRLEFTSLDPHEAVRLLTLLRTGDRASIYVGHSGGVLKLGVALIGEDGEGMRASHVLDVFQRFMEGVTGPTTGLAETHHYRVTRQDDGRDVDA